jgi:predicted AlkP superfamily pyrophosphatase or phosphodiesterase
LKGDTALHPFTRRFWNPKQFRLLALLLVLVSACAAQSGAPVIEVPNAPNSAAQQAKPYVVLVSLDGFRYDYPKKYEAPNLVALGRRGASAPDGMIPSYPSSTFPNHLAIITGLYPEHHGIVNNLFYDPALKERYTYTDPKTSLDGRWYGGTPLWSLAEKQGMRAACYFWPGSEAEIAGARPSYYVHFDPSIAVDTRIDQIISWLQLPPAQRPHFLTLYIEDVDGAGHQFGPDSPEVAAAVKHVDAEVGTLSQKLDALHLPIDLIVIADHGMEKEIGPWVSLNQYADLSQAETAGPLIYAKTEADTEKIYKSLNGASEKFKVYRRANIPAALHYDANPRTGDPVVIATGPYPIRAIAPPPDKDRPFAVGAHGFDPAIMPTMKAIFFAAGPDIRLAAELPPFENINVYPLIAKILGLEIGAIDGKLSTVQSALKSPPRK